MPKVTANRSRRKAKSGKPKLKKDCPLFAHSNGRLMKWINGKQVAFGRWGHRENGKVVPVDDVKAAVDAAVEEYYRTKDDREAGRTPPPKPGSDDPRLDEVVSAYLVSMDRKVQSGDVSSRHFAETRRSRMMLLDTTGRDVTIREMTPDRFGKLRAALSKGRGPVTVGGHVQRIRCAFKFAYESGLIDQPVRFGGEFSKPKRSVVRKDRAAKGRRDFSRDEVTALLDRANPQLKAAILIAVNCGLGAKDIAELRERHVDLKRGWLDFPRPKTGVERRAKLWDETVEALRVQIKTRTRAANRDDGDRLFLSAVGTPVVRQTEATDPKDGDNRTDLIAAQFGHLKHKIDIKKSRGFYSLRHTCRTVAAECKDPEAVGLVMGHSDDSMAANYTARISDDRMEAVAQTIHNWLYSE